MRRFIRGDIRHEKPGAGALRGERVMRVPERTSRHRQTSASYAAVQLISQFREPLDAVVQVCFPTGRQVAPVLGGGDPIVGKRRERVADAGQGNAQALRDFDDGDAAQNIAGVLALIAQGAGGLDEALRFVEMERRNRYSGALSDFANAEE